MATVLDWRDKQPNPPPRLLKPNKQGVLEKCYRTGRDGKVFVRDPRSVTGICLHQTAVVYGPSGDTKRRNERAFDIPIHAVAFRDGTVVLPYPALWLLYHGNGWNDSTLGLEIEGLYCGLEDDPRTTAVREDLQTAPGRNPNKVDYSTTDSARTAVKALYDEGKRLGCPLKYIVAHRQSSPTRRADPGQALWQAVAVEYAIKELGLVPDCSRVLSGSKGSGRPIPGAWDPERGVGPY